MRITAVLFCFNQETHVGQAIHDLFQQDAEDLEIILSDDSSSDSTFEILTSEARRYRGPHPVSVRRTRTNVGLNAHINRVVELATGDLIVPFAGDDRFHPSRARRLAMICEADNALLVHSLCTFIGPDGTAVEPINQTASFYHTTDPSTVALSQALFIGATAAWRRDLFTKYGPLPETRAYEDLVLGFRAALERRVSFLPEPVVHYRVGTGISTRNLEGTDITQRRDHLQRWRDVLRARLADARIFGLPENDPISASLTNQLQEIEARLACYGVISAGRSSLWKYFRPRSLRFSGSELTRRLRRGRKPR